MLDDVEAGYRTDARIIQAPKMSKKIFLTHIEAAATALVDLNSIRINAACIDPFLSQNLQPLATSATKIDNRRLFPDVRQVNFETFLDLFATAAKAIFERRVKRIELVRIAGDFRKGLLFAMGQR